jgi:hypothetical protein
VIFELLTSFLNKKSKKIVKKIKKIPVEIEGHRTPGHQLARPFRRLHGQCVVLEQHADLEVLKIYMFFNGFLKFLFFDYIF